MMLVRIAVLVSMTCLSATPPAAADFRTTLATRLNTDPGYFVLNLPPRPTGWPGTIYTSDMRFTIAVGRADDPSLLRGSEFSVRGSIDTDLGAQAGGGIARFFGLSVAASQAAVAGVTIKQARTYDLTLEQLRLRVLQLSDPQRRPPGPIIVYRAYEGIPSLTVTRRAGASADAWAQVKRNAHGVAASVSGTTEDVFSIETTEPVVFAFEIVQAADLLRLTSATREKGCFGSCQLASDRPIGGPASPAAFGADSNVSATINGVEARTLEPAFGLKRIPVESFERLHPAGALPPRP